MKKSVILLGYFIACNSFIGEGKATEEEMELLIELDYGPANGHPIEYLSSPSSVLTGMDQTGHSNFNLNATITPRVLDKEEALKD